MQKIRFTSKKASRGNKLQRAAGGKGIFLNPLQG